MDLNNKIFALILFFFTFPLFAQYQTREIHFPFIKDKQSSSFILNETGTTVYVFADNLIYEVSVNTHKVISKHNIQNYIQSDMKGNRTSMLISKGKIGLLIYYVTKKGTCQKLQFLTFSKNFSTELNKIIAINETPITEISYYYLFSSTQNSGEIYFFGTNTYCDVLKNNILQYEKGQRQGMGNAYDFTTDYFYVITSLDENQVVRDQKGKIIYDSKLFKSLDKASIRANNKKLYIGDNQAYYVFDIAKQKIEPLPVDLRYQIPWGGVFINSSLRNTKKLIIYYL